MANTIYKVTSLNRGKVEKLTFVSDSYDSAIRKKPVQESIFLSKLGLDGDEHAYHGHGGVDKALCLYPADHYPHWKNVLDHFVETALFGENITVLGLTEDKAHIGDIFSYGDSIIQISEPREPCSKLAIKYNEPNLVKQMVTTGYTGFMFRVLQEGFIKPTDDLRLVEPDPMKVSIDLVNDVTYIDKKNKEKLEKVLSVDALSSPYRDYLLERI